MQRESIQVEVWVQRKYMENTPNSGASVTVLEKDGPIGTPSLSPWLGQSQKVRKICHHKVKAQ